MMKYCVPVTCRVDEIVMAESAQDAAAIVRDTVDDGEFLPMPMWDVGAARPADCLMEHAADATGEVSSVRVGPYGGPDLMVVISFSWNGAKLLGANGGHYLPCSGCRRVFEVELNVVSYFCRTCDTHKGAFTTFATETDDTAARCATCGAIGGHFPDCLALEGPAIATESTEAAANG